VKVACVVLGLVVRTVLERLRPVLALAAGRAAWFVLALLAQIGWRTAAAAAGVLAAGWLASSVPAMLDTRAQASAPSPVSLSSTGSLAALAARPTMPDWVEVQRPVTTFALGVADVDGQPLRLLARRDRASSAREDRLSAGDFPAAGAYFSLALKRQHDVQESGFFVDMTRHLAEGALAVQRGAQALPLASKFGLVEAADMMLSDGQAVRACLVFRHLAGEIGFAFHGVLCGSAARAADRQQLTCLLDRVNLLAAGDDRPLRGYFSRAELRRQASCTPPKLQQAGRKASWLDDGQARPALRRGG